MTNPQKRGYCFLLIVSFAMIGIGGAYMDSQPRELPTANVVPKLCFELNLIEVPS